jgi:hypothetical protein
MVAAGSVVSCGRALCGADACCVAFCVASALQSALQLSGTDCPRGVAEPQEHDGGRVKNAQKAVGSGVRWGTPKRVALFWWKKRARSSGKAELSAAPGSPPLPRVTFVRRSSGCFSNQVLVPPTSALPWTRLMRMVAMGCKIARSPWACTNSPQRFTSSGGPSRRSPLSLRARPS